MKNFLIHVRRAGRKVTLSYTEETGVSPRLTFDMIASKNLKYRGVKTVIQLPKSHFADRSGGILRTISEIDVSLFFSFLHFRDVRLLVTRKLQKIVMATVRRGEQTHLPTFSRFMNVILYSDAPI